jgi:hypothetical protein
MSARPLLAHLSLHEVCDLWAAPWRRRGARGDGLIVRYGDDGLVGVPPQDDAEPFVSDLRARGHRLHRALPPEKTRLMACGRWARARRQRRGQGHPDTFALLGVTHLWSKTRTGQWTGRRKTIAKRLRPQGQESTQRLREQRPWPLRQLGAWLQRVLTGHARYEGVPRHRGMRRGVRAGIRRSWCQTLRRRSQRPRSPWQRPDALATPYPASLSRATCARYDPRQEPGAVVPHAGICAGGG